MGRPKVRRGNPPKLEPGEWVWAYRYLIDTATSMERLQAIEGIIYQENSINYYLQSIPITAEGREWIEKLKNALRQHRLRERKKDMKAYSFRLSEKAKKTLTLLAKKHGRAENELMSELIENELDRVVGYEQRIRDLQARINAESGSRMQLDAVWKIKHTQAMEQVKRLATRLSEWELATGKLDPEYRGNQAQLQREITKKVNAVKGAIAYAEAFHNTGALRYTYSSPLLQPTPPMRGDPFI